MGWFGDFFCDDPTCGKVTFAEQMPVIAQRYARKTQRIKERLRQIGFESGGEAGKRLSYLFDISISGDQMIRLVRTASEAG